MAKSKFTLALKPTFSAKVGIPVPGSTTELVEFKFKGRTRDEFRELIDGLKDREDVDVILDIAAGWELEEPFDKDHVEELNQNYIGAARAIIEKYIAELTQARLGN